MQPGWIVSNVDDVDARMHQSVQNLNRETEDAEDDALVEDRRFDDRRVRHH